MMLAESTTTLECSKPLKISKFGIGDPILIMEYLRKNAYSNPKRAICQEIMCNARDAHREIGVNMPIVVKLPTRMQPVWSCRDFGPGISPDRMENVFLLFGNSTKRIDNKQTGGFGVGAKTPWAYTDTFLITTICNIEGRLIKYHYAAVIGEDRQPDLIQMAEPCLSDENHTGTTISFNVEANAQNDFARYSYEVSAFWKVRPEITGNDDYKSVWEKKGIESHYKYQDTNKWAILNERCSDRAIVLIDDIPYVLNVDSLGEQFTYAERSILRYNGVHLFFGVGELTVSLNRESLYYDDRTIKTIIARLRDMIEYLRKHFEAKVASSATLWDAAVALKEAIGFFNENATFLKGIMWSGKVIPTEAIYGGSTDIEIFHYEKQPKDSYKYPNMVRRFSRCDNKIHFNNNSALIDGDSKVRIEHMFTKNPNLKHVYSFRRSSYGDDAVYNKWLVANGLMDLGPIKVDTLEAPPKIPRGNGGNRAAYRRIKTYIWNGHDWADTELTSNDLENGSAIYVPCFRRRACTDNTCDHELTSQSLSVGDFTQLFRNPNLKIFGIQKDLLPELGKGWVSLYDYVRNTIVSEATDKKVSVGDILNTIYRSNGSRLQELKELFKVVSENIKSMPVAMKAWYEASMVIDTLTADKSFKFCSNRGYERVYDFIVNKDMIAGIKTINNLRDEAYDESKLLISIPFNQYGYNTASTEHLGVYLQAVAATQKVKAKLAS